MSELIDRQAAIDAIAQCTNCGDEDTLREYVLKHNLDNGWTGGILEALDAVKDLPTAQSEKAQHSRGSTTSDLISKTETVEHLRRVLDATVPITDYDKGYVDGVEFGISTVSTMPTIQPQSTAGQLNDSAQSTAQSTDLIDRQAVIDALHTWFRDGFDEDKWWNSTHVLAAIEGLPSVQQEHKWETCFECPLSHGCPKIKGCTNEQAIEYASQIPNDCPLSAQPNLQPTCNQLATDTNVGDTISRQAAIDALDCINGVEEVLRSLPPAQPEPHEGHWIRTDCGLDVECKCSVCGYKDFVEPHDTYWFKRNYCPNCGARMKGERQK